MKKPRSKRRQKVQWEKDLRRMLHVPVVHPKPMSMEELAQHMASVDHTEYMQGLMGTFMLPSRILEEEPKFVSAMRSRIHIEALYGIKLA